MQNHRKHKTVACQFCSKHGTTTKKKIGEGLGDKNCYNFAHDCLNKIVGQKTLIEEYCNFLLSLNCVILNCLVLNCKLSDFRFLVTQLL